MGEDWAVLCQASFQSIKEEKWIEMHDKGWAEGGWPRHSGLEEDIAIIILLCQS